jgi:protein SCO1
MTGRFVRLATPLLFALMAPVVARAAPDLSLVKVEEHLGAALPLDLRFRDQESREVTLRDLFTAGKPVLMVLAYYDCPMLCGLVLRATANALGQVGLVPGRDFRIVTVSFNPDDQPQAAAQKRAATLAGIGRPEEAPSLWPFLTGAPSAIERLAASLGFVAVRDQGTGQYAHPAVLFVLTPEGRISRYLYGIEFAPRDVRLALVEASHGAIGTTADHLLLRCFAYDPATRRYGLFISTFMRLGAAAVLAGLLALILGLVWHGRKKGAP